MTAEGEGLRIPPGSDHSETAELLARESADEVTLNADQMKPPESDSDKLRNAKPAEEPHGDNDEDAQSAVRHLFGRGLLFGLILVAQSAVMILVTPIIVRLLGGYQYGQVAVVMTIGQFLLVLTGLGLQTGIHRHFAEEEGDLGTRSLLTASLLITLIVTIAINITGPFWAPILGFSGYTHALQCGVWWAGFGAIGLFIAATLRSQDRLREFMTVLGIQAIGSQFIALGIVIFVAHTAYAYVGGLLIGQAAGVITGLFLVRPRIHGVWNRTALWGCLAISLPLVPHGLALQVLNLGDRVVVQRDLGSRAVARYQVAYNASAFPIVLLTILNNAWQPKIFDVAEHLRKSVLSQSRDQLLRLITPALLGTALVAPVALRLLAPPSFRPDTLLLVYTLVACSAIPYLGYMTNLRTLLAFRRTTNMMWATPLCAVTNILLNLWLVPILGITGSALATLASFGLLALITTPVASKVCRLDRVTWQVCLGPALAVGASFACILLPTSPMFLVIRMLGVLGCAAWIALLIRRVAATGRQSASV